MFKGKSKRLNIVLMEAVFIVSPGRRRVCSSNSSRRQEFGEDMSAQEVNIFIYDKRIT